jgi:DNA invertase Pin-like site-specific DNA recombinase
MKRYVAYYRVSTDKQGESGLGLEAQRHDVKPYAAGIIASFTEIESGKVNARPELAKALDLARREDAAILIAKIDRLSRDAGFLLTLRNSGVEIVAADMPHAGTLEFGIRAVVAQHEREEISRRTKAALAAARARGVKLGSRYPARGGKACAAILKARAAAFAATVLPTIRELQAAGAHTVRAIAAGLVERGIPTARGNRTWHPSQVANVLKYAA